VEVEAQDDLASLAFFLNRRVERAEQAHAALVAEANAVAFLQSLGRLCQCPPALGADALDQRCFNFNG
jgi:hypothetical protein